MGDKTRYITLFTALVAASFGVRSAGKQSKPPVSSPAPAVRAHVRVPAAAGLVATFNDFDKTSSSGCSGTGIDTGTRYMHWAIATVPDPVRSNLKLDFDREIEAIQNAASSSGYQFERFWFPWHSTTVLDADSSDSAAPAGERRQSDMVPGVLLFHKTNPGLEKDSGLALFLVGETPTSGINPGQFRTAVCYGSLLQSNDTLQSNDAALRSNDNKPGDKGVTIIGPAYSASFDSLAQLGADLHLHVYSWTSDYESQSDFETKTHADLHTTRAPTFSAINSFIQFLRGQWHESGPVVVLKEEGTALAAGLTRDTKDKATALRDPGVRLMEFPRNLSKLRNASETEAVATVAPSDSASPIPEVPHQGLTLSLKDDSASFEIPTFAQTQTPVSQESVLFSIGNLLKTGTAHYAAIVASDPLDVLYLSRYLRSACPNLRLFLLDPDLLLEHGADSADFEGILGVTTYPLFPSYQRWHSTGEALEVFPSENYQAAYNATIAAVSALSSGAPHYIGIEHPQRLQPDDARRFPLWVTVAGKNGFEPIAILPPGNGPLTRQILGQELLTPEYWDSWGYLFALLLLACLAFALGIGAASAGGETAPSVFAVKPLEEGAPARALCITAIGTCLSVLALTWVAVPSEVVLLNLPSAPHGLINKWLPFGLFCAGAFSAAAALAVTAQRRRGVSNSVSGPWRLRDLFFPRTPAPLTGFSCSTAVLALSVAFAYPEPFGTETAFVLPQLWHILSLGSFFLGIAVVATACPVWDLLQCHAPITQTHILRTSRPRMRKLWAPTFVAVVFAALAVFGSVSLLVRFALRSPDSAVSHFFLACRSLNLTSTVSPLVPFSLLLIVLLMVAFVHLKRIVYYEDRCPTVPYLRKGYYCPRLRLTVAETRRRTTRMAFHPAYALAGIAFLVLVYRVWISHTHTTFETSLFEHVLIYTALMAGFLLVLVWIRVLLVWSSFNEFLQQLERHPLRHVFSLLPRGFVWSPVWQGGGKRRTHVAITRSLECIVALQNNSRVPEKLKDTIETRIHEIKRQVKELLEVSATRRRIPRLLFRELERNLSEVSAAAADYIETRKWEGRAYEPEPELAMGDEAKDLSKPPAQKSCEEDPAELCGQLVAFRFLSFINYVLWQLDNMVGFLSFGFLLLVLALNSYDFRAHSIIDWLLMLLFVIISGGILTALAQAARDAILSQISGTKEGKLDRNFVWHAISFGALPVLVLAATHFPSVGRFFFSWVKPALEAIH